MSATPIPRFTFSAPRSVLSEALRTITSFLPARAPSIPVLSCVRIDVGEVQASGLADATLAATDLDSAVSLVVPVSATGSGGIVVPARRLAEIVASLPAGAIVTIAVEEHNIITVTTGRARFSLAGMGTPGFPMLPGRGDGATTSLSAQVISALATAAPLASGEVSRPGLRAVCLEVTDGVLAVVASDGHQLLRLVAGPAGDYPTATQTLVPPAIVPILARLFGAVPADAPLTLAVTENRATLSTDRALVSFRLCEGPYANYGLIIKQRTPSHTLVVERAALLAAFTRVAVASDAARRVTLSLGGDTGTDMLLTSTSEGGASEDIVSAESHTATSGEPLSVDLHASWCISLLTALSVERVRLTFTTSTQAVFIRPVDGDPLVLALSMPLTTPIARPGR